MKATKNRYPELLLWCTAIFLLFVAINYFGNATEVFLTNHISLSSKKDPWLLALVQTLAVILLLVVLRFTAILCFRVLRSPHRFLYFGIFFIVLGGGGLLAILLTAPTETIKKNIHVVIIGACFLLLGVWMILSKKTKG